VHNYDAQQHRAGQIISPLTLQTITTAQILSVGVEGVLDKRGQKRISMYEYFLQTNKGDSVSTCVDADDSDASTAV